MGSRLKEKSFSRVEMEISGVQLRAGLRMELRRKGLEGSNPQLIESGTAPPTSMQMQDANVA